MTSSHEAQAYRVLVAAGVTLVVYYLAHVFTGVESARLAHPMETFLRDLRKSTRHESSVLLGGLPAMLVVVVAVLFGVSTSVAVDLALWTTVGLLGLLGWFVGRASRATGWRLAAEVVGAALFGMILVVLKSVLH
ncbi:hypothetical protein FOE78_22155 [Microlunatus elymi]|uniref:Uncharacterized protein n=1 Tax=Microlunatus elymi TaxID=2596828 RepID=A0A516Q469_9ACTN|nr:hypothetical protein [Microlunatus elymi]QDP98247.1 hypothetical protein FOE78_22155 [Microlunatus elymi]